MLDMAEITVRMLEGVLNIHRPPGMTAEQAVKDFHKKDPDLCESFIRGTHAVIAYFIEQAETHHWSN